jgi:Family of unknown function (DUF6283)
MDVRSEPCTACPYRRDAPSGLWAADEYAKLRDYDAPTAQQPLAAFRCHATPDHYCHGWAVCHSTRGHAHELIALRLAHVDTIPAAAVPLFASGTEAADHGARDVDAPAPHTIETAARLLRKYPRLRED